MFPNGSSANSAGGQNGQLGFPMASLLQAGGPAAAGLQNLNQAQIFSLLQNPGLFTDMQKRAATASAQHVILAQQQAAAQQQAQQRERELKEQREREQKQQQLKREQQQIQMLRIQQQQQANQKANQQASNANQAQVLQNMQQQQSQQQTTSASVATSRSDEPRRPSLMSNLQQTPQSQLNLNLLKPDPKPSNFGSITSGVPLRPNSFGLNLPAQPATTTTLNKPVEQKPGSSQQQGQILEEKREKKDVRDKIDKTEADLKMIDAQHAAAKKKREQLQNLLRTRREEMERERVEAEAEARAAAAKAASIAEAIRSRIPMIEKIDGENQATIEERFKSMNLAQTSTLHSDTPEEITARYRNMRPSLIEQMKRQKDFRDRKMREHQELYESKYQQWLKRVDKAEKAPKKVARDAKHRELFEKIFPEIKKEREDRERNERHERIQQAAEGVIKTKEEKVTERACQIPQLQLNREKFAFVNNNTVIREELLANTNEALSDYTDNWTPDEKKTFNEKIKLFGKNFHALSHFYWNKTAKDMVKYYYATKSEMKYKMFFPKNKKKPNKLAKPIPMPEFREMFDHLMDTCTKRDIFTHICCVICDGDMKIFTAVPSMSMEKERLYKKILKEQELRQKLPICTKCFGAFKKTAIRCPVGTCPGGKRKQKPSRAPPPEFYDQPLENQCAIVRKLRFHPAAPKICSNCYKRIQQEIENIEDNPYYKQPLPVPQAKRKPNWSAARVRQLFDLVQELGREWLLISQRLADPQNGFKPSPRQARALHERLRYFWMLKDRRITLQKQARKISKQYRRIRRNGSGTLKLRKQQSSESDDVVVIDEIKREPRFDENGTKGRVKMELPPKLEPLQEVPSIIGVKRPAHMDSIAHQMASHTANSEALIAQANMIEQNRMGITTTAGNQSNSLPSLLASQLASQENMNSQPAILAAQATVSAQAAAELAQLSQAIQDRIKLTQPLQLQPAFQNEMPTNTDVETIRLLLLHFKIPSTSPTWRDELERSLRDSSQKELALLQYRLNSFRQSKWEEPRCLTGVGIKFPLNGALTSPQQQSGPPPAKKAKEDRPVDENRPTRKSGLATAALDQTPRRPTGPQSVKQLAPPNNTHRPASTPLAEDLQRKPLKQELANIQHARTPDPTLGTQSDDNETVRDVRKKALTPTPLTDSKNKINSSTENTAPIYEELSDSDSDQSRPPSTNGQVQKVVEKRVPEWPPMVNMWNLEPEELEKIRSLRIPLLKLPPIHHPEPGQPPSPPYEDLSD
uniref:SANT domain-containing protein n=1 Tax=Bursaphelenchus xylophilus TaxID=6326 RepID=A0A1I7RV02_BURXY